MIPYGRQSIDEEEITAVINVLKSDYLTTGPWVETFEKKVSDYCGAKYAIAVSNGTAALHIAALALGIEKNDIGITSPNTFLASANCMAYCGATPDFADISMDTYCIQEKTIRNKITPDTKLLIPVHFAGHPCEMESIWETAKANNLFVIEDAAHAIGSTYKDTHGNTVRVGSCVHSHLAIFSFHPVKTITTGEGGMILTNDEELAYICRLLRNHGMEKTSERFSGIPITSSSKEPFYYEMQTLGFNYRMTDIQSALGIVQMSKLDKFIEKRRSLWRAYNDAFKDIAELSVPIEKEGVQSAWHLYVARTANRDSLLKTLREKGIGAHAMYIPVHLQPWYQKKYGYKKGDFPNSEKYFETCIVLPLYPSLKQKDQEYIIDTVKAFIKK